MNEWLHKSAENRKKYNAYQRDYQRRNYSTNPEYRNRMLETQRRWRNRKNLNIKRQWIMDNIELLYNEMVNLKEEISSLKMEIQLYKSEILHRHKVLGDDSDGVELLDQNIWFNSMEAAKYIRCSVPLATKFLSSVECRLGKKRLYRKSDIDNLLLSGSPFKHTKAGSISNAKLSNPIRSGMTLSEAKEYIAGLNKKSV